VAFDAGPGRPVGPPLDPGGGAHGERGSDEPSGGGKGGQGGG
jgi:hypothetical protein